MPISRRFGREAWDLAVVTLVSFVPRLWFWLLPRSIERDGVWYASLAESLAAARGYLDITGAPHATFPPGLPVAIALLVPLTGDGEAAGRIVSLVTGTLMPALLYLTARRLVGREAALVAALLAALQPRLVYLSTAVLSEALYTCLLVALTAAGVAALRTLHPGLMLGAGLLAGAAACVRPEGYLVAGAFAVAALVVAGAGRRKVVGLVAFGLGALLLIGPYALTLYRTSGQVLTGKWHNLDAVPAVSGGWTAGSALGRFGTRIVANVFTLEAALATELSIVLVALVLIGVVLLHSTVPHAAWTFLVLAPVVSCAGMLLFTIKPRFVSTIYPWLFVAAGLGIDRLWRARPAIPRLATIVAVAIVAVHFAPGLAHPLRFSRWAEPQLQEHRLAGLWIRESLGRGRRIASLVPDSAFYAKGRWTPWQPGEDAAWIEAAARAGVELVVVDEEMSRRTDPRLLAYLGADLPRGLRVVRDFAPHPGRRVRVLALR